MAKSYKRKMVSRSAARTPPGGDRSQILVLAEVAGIPTRVGCLGCL
jgi:hypothetical protein